MKAVHRQEINVSRQLVLFWATTCFSVAVAACFPDPEDLLAPCPDGTLLSSNGECESAVRDSGVDASSADSRHEAAAGLDATSTRSGDGMVSRDSSRPVVVNASDAGDGQNDLDASEDEESNVDAEVDGDDVCRSDCILGSSCSANRACLSGVCSRGVCRPDCSPDCGQGTECLDQTDCESAICTKNLCRPACSPTCSAGQVCFEDIDCSSGNPCVSEICRPNCSTSCSAGQNCYDTIDCSTGNKCVSGTCRPDCSDSCAIGESCLDATDCSTGNKCVSGTCRPDCSDSCAIGESCFDENDCASLDCYEGTCRPSCSPNCEGGETCVTDYDCNGGGTCHRTANLCLNVCNGSANIQNALSLQDYRYCSEITGDLNVNPTEDLSDIDPFDFLPYLRIIGGELQRFTSDDNIDDLVLPELEFTESIALMCADNLFSFPSLTTVGSNAATSGYVLVAQGGGTIFDFPALQTVNGGVQIGMTAIIKRIHMPKLETVTGDFVLVAHTALNDVNVPRLTTVGGDLHLEFLIRLPWSEISHLNSSSIVNGSITIRDIGCCLYIDYYNCISEPYDCE